MPKRQLGKYTILLISDALRIIRSDLIQKFVPPPTDADGLLFCACGPTPFTQEAVR